MHRFPSLALKSRIDARKRGVNRQKLASILKSVPEIKNRCTKEGVNREKLASIRKSEPEIKIDAALRCGVGLQTKPFCFAATKLESDADLVAASAVAGETILLRRDEIRIGRGHRCRYNHCRRAILLCGKEN